MTSINSVSILIAEDDDEDYYLTTKALQRGRVANQLFRVKNGKELLDYLRHQESYADASQFPRPHIILLDLNMPVMDGLTALKLLKADPDLSRIPVVIFTTSDADEDVIRGYALGVNSFIRKPLEFSRFVEVLSAVSEYWFQIVELPE